MIAPSRLLLNAAPAAANPASKLVVVGAGKFFFLI